MYFPDPLPGMVFQYSYLWVREHLQGQEEGRKDRPAVVVLATEIDDGHFVVTVAPVTTSSPGDRRNVLEIPPQTKQRLGLDHRQSFVVLTEVNRFRWPGSDATPVDSDRFHYGFLPTKTFDRMKARIMELAQERRLKFAVRSE